MSAAMLEMGATHSQERSIADPAGTGLQRWLWRINCGTILLRRINTPGRQCAASATDDGLALGETGALC